MTNFFLFGRRSLPNLSNEKNRKSDPNLTPNFRIVRFLFFIIIIIILTGVFFTSKWLRLFKHPDLLRQLILNTGIWAPLVTVGLQMIQVLIALLPGQVVAFVSGYVFGGLKGTIISMVGITIGSVIAFLLTRLTGRRLLKYFLHKTTFERLDDYILKNGPLLLFLLLLIPNPLGDSVYYLAGLTNFPLSFFIILVIICRLPSNILHNMIGAKGVNFTIYHWIIFGLIIVIFVLLYYLYQKRIVAILLRLANRKRLRRNSFPS